MQKQQLVTAVLSGQVAEIVLHADPGGHGWEVWPVPVDAQGDLWRELTRRGDVLRAARGDVRRWASLDRVYRFITDDLRWTGAVRIEQPLMKVQ